MPEPTEDRTNPCCVPVRFALDGAASCVSAAALVTPTSPRLSRARSATARPGLQPVLARVERLTPLRFPLRQREHHMVVDPPRPASRYILSASANSCSRSARPRGTMLHFATWLAWYIGRAMGPESPGQPRGPTPYFCSYCGR